MRCWSHVTSKCGEYGSRGIGYTDSCTRTAIFAVSSSPISSLIRTISSSARSVCTNPAAQSETTQVCAAQWRDTL